MEQYGNIRKCMTFCSDFELPYVAISRVLEDFQGEVAGGLTPPRVVPSLFKTPRYGGYTKKILNPFALINKHNHSTIASSIPTPITPATCNHGFERRKRCQAHLFSLRDAQGCKLFMVDHPTWRVLTHRLRCWRSPWLRRTLKLLRLW